MSVRFSQASTHACTTSANDSARIPFGDRAWGGVSRPSGSSVATITWWAAHSKTGTPFQVKDNGNDVTTSFAAVNLGEPIPDACSPWNYLIPVVDVAGNIESNIKT